MKPLTTIVKNELARFKKKHLKAVSREKDNDKLNSFIENQPYELYAKFLSGKYSLEIPLIIEAEETLDYLIEHNSSLCRFGDGEFSLIKGGGIHFQQASSGLAERLSEVLSSDENNLLIALPDVFGDLDCYTDEVADFWRKWLVKKRDYIYSRISLSKKYYSAFFTRVYMPYKKIPEHEDRCVRFFQKVKKIWYDRDVIICEGEGTRFGVFNDLLDGAKSVSRVICPARNAYSKYPDILSFCDGIERDRIILLALGPTATVLGYDLHRKGFQAIDIGHMDVEYEWFLRKDAVGKPIENKYVDGSKAGRKITAIDDEEYESQIIGKLM